MKNGGILIGILFILLGCSSTKKLEATAPFSLGEPYAQEWVITEEPKKEGYKVVIPILSLDKEEAILKNLYHKGKMTALEITLTEMGNMAIAEYGKAHQEGMDTLLRKLEEPFPFDLSETQAVISYVNNEKVKYYLINGIQKKLPVTYPTVADKMGH